MRWISLCSPWICSWIPAGRTEPDGQSRHDAMTDAELGDGVTQLP